MHSLTVVFAYPEYSLNIAFVYREYPLTVVLIALFTSKNIPQRNIHKKEHFLGVVELLTNQEPLQLLTANVRTPRTFINVLFAYRGNSRTREL